MVVNDCMVSWLEICVVLYLMHTHYFRYVVRVSHPPGAHRLGLSVGLQCHISTVWYRSPQAILCGSAAKTLCCE